MCVIMSKSIAKVSLLCFSLLVLSIIGFYFSQIVLASDTTNTYTYNSGQGTIHFIYEGEALYPPTWVADTFAGTEIGDYTNVQSEDGNRIALPDYGANFEGFYRFNFTISEDEGDIDWIYWHINGYIIYGGGEAGECYVANFNTPAWELFYTFSGVASDQDATINITTNPAYYVDDANSQIVVYCGGKNLDDVGDISIDYVSVEIGSSEPVSCDGSISNLTIEFPDAGPGESIEPIVQSSSGTLREAINVSITQGTNCKVGIYAQTWYNDTSDHSFNVTEYEKYTVNPAGDIDWESITTYVPYEEANIVYPATCSGQDAPFNCSFYFNLTIPSGQFPSDYNKTVVFRITEV